MKPRNLREVSDRGALAPIRESVEEREAREAWEQAMAADPWKPGEDAMAYTDRIKAKAEEIRAKSQWWDK